MKEHKYHGKILSGIFSQLKEIFNASEQAMYIYIDDIHKVCNKNFASMLGYKSPEEWAKVDENFPTAFVANKSQATLINAYQNALEKGIGSTLKVEWKRKSGGTVKTSIILVPIAYQGHLMALHFISKI